MTTLDGPIPRSSRPSRIRANAPARSEPAREGWLLKRFARRAREAAGNLVAWADAGGRAAADQADPTRARKEFGACDRDRVAGAARLHREVQVFVDERIDDNARVGGAVDVNPTGERARIRGAVLQDLRVLDDQPCIGRAARHVDAVVDEV